MDIAAAGAAASQISTAQRTQQAALAGIRQARVQGATLANLLGQISSTSTAADTSSAISAPSSTSNDNLVQADQPSRSLPRGSLVNILV
jgi:hypothetical protein